MELNNVIGLVLGLIMLIMLLLIFWLFDKIKDERIKSGLLLLKKDEREKEILRYENLVKERKLEADNQKLEFEKQKAEITLASNQRFLLEIEKYKEGELEKEKVKISQHTKDTYELLLKKWKKDFEMEIRKDAKFRSYSSLKGKSAENLLPFYTNFPFNSQDTRFLGNPVDLIIFDGLSEPGREIDIYIVEIKTGGSRLNTNQQRVKDAAEKRRIAWKQINAEDIQADSVKPQ